MWLTEVGKKATLFSQKNDVILICYILNIHYMISLGITVYESRTKSKLILKGAKWWLTEINLHIFL